MGRPKQEAVQTKTVEPVDTEAVEVPQSPVAPLESVTPKITDPCWNCGEQLTDGACTNCGFDKSLLHNLKLEEERINELNQKG